MIRGLLVVLQALLWLLLLRFVLRAFASVISRARGGAPAAGPRPQVRAPEDLVQDPVCHTHVPRSRAITTRVHGREEWFCSTGCRDRALAGVARVS